VACLTTGQTLLQFMTMFNKNAWGGHYAALDQLNKKELMPRPTPSFDWWQTPLVGRKRDSKIMLHYQCHCFKNFTKGLELPNTGTGLFLRCFNDCPGRSEAFVLESGEPIDLGCIVPLRKEDIKTRLELEIKNFIFPGGPESYARERSRARYWFASHASPNIITIIAHMCSTRARPVPGTVFHMAANFAMAKASVGPWLPSVGSNWIIVCRSTTASETLDSLIGAKETMDNPLNRLA
jgi:hypothetical protein